MHFKEIISVSLILFSVIDILGSLPFIINLKAQGKIIEPLKVTLISGIIMIAFLFTGEIILNLLNLDVKSFALAGAVVLFLIGMEMISGIKFFRDSHEHDTPTVVPLAFPLIAGAGTMTTLISLKAEYHVESILIGVFLNLIFIWLTLRSSGWIYNKIGSAGTNILRKVFGMILLAIAIKLFTTNFKL